MDAQNALKKQHGPVLLEQVATAFEKSDKPQFWLYRSKPKKVFILMGDFGGDYYYIAEVSEDTLINPIGEGSVNPNATKNQNKEK